jgi:hypothetical protein
MADVPVIISKSIRLREGAAPSNPVNIGTPQEPLNPDGSTAGPDPNKVSYNVADLKTATEKNQARVNIGSTSSTPQIITSSGNINDLAKTSNFLVFTDNAVKNLTGILAGTDGEELIIYNDSTGNLLVFNENSNSSVNNQIKTTPFTLTSNQYALFKYKTGINKWVFADLNLYLKKNVPETGTLDLNTGTGEAVFRTTRADTASNSIFRIINSLDIDLFRMEADGSVNFRIRRNAGLWRILNRDGNPVVTISTGGLITFTSGIISRSVNSERTVRRDELPFNYPETVATAGTINNLALDNEGVKLLILTLADDLTGVVPVTTNTGRELKIEGRNAGGVIIRHDSASSTAANRFSLPGATDLTIANGEVYTFIYTNSRWRRAQ